MTGEKHRVLVEGTAGVSANHLDASSTTQQVCVEKKFYPFGSISGDISISEP